MNKRYFYTLVFSILTVTVSLSQTISVDAFITTNTGAVIPEECPGSEVLLTVGLNPAPSENTEVQVIYDGSAAPSDDYEIMWDLPLLFEVGEDAKVFPVDVLEDQMEEGSEIAVIYFMIDGDTAGVVDFTIVDEVIVEIIPEDSVFLCKGESAILSATTNIAGSPILWSPQDSITPLMGSPVVVNPSVTTTYVASVSSGICLGEDTIVVKVDSLPEFDITAVPEPMEPCLKYCEGEKITLFTMPADEEKFPDINFQWMPLTGFISDPSDQNAALTALETNEYIRINTNGACVSQDSILIQVIPSSIPISLEDTTVCFQKPVDVSINPEGLSSIMWEPEQGLSCTSCPNPTIVASTTQTYTVTATAEMCCPVSASITVNVDIPPIATEGAETCPGKPVEIMVTDPEVENIQWVNSAGLSCDDCPNPIAVVDETTTFIVEGMIDGCLARGTATVTVTDSVFNILIQGDTVCAGMNVELMVLTPNVTNPMWNGPPGTLSCINCLMPTINVQQTSDFTLTGLINNCPAAGVVRIETYPEPNPDIETSLMGGNTTPVGNILDLQLTGVPQAMNIQWFYNNIQLPGSDFLNTVQIQNEGENNIITVQFTTPEGCQYTETIIIIGVRPTIEIPNAFTPNEDDRNDFFRPVITNGDFIPDLVEEFRVFNRWGTTLYDNDDPSQGWDGRYKGEYVPPGVYMYYIKVIYPDGEEEIFKGDVTVIR